MSPTAAEPRAPQVEQPAANSEVIAPASQPFVLTVIKIDLIHCYLALEDDERRCLFCLAVYAKCGSYQQTADMLGLSGKTSARRRITRIGKVLGLKLVERTSSISTALTRVGEEVVKLIEPEFKRGLDLVSEETRRKPQVVVVD